MKSRLLRNIGSSLFLAVPLALIGLVWLRQETVYDWLRLKNYQPPATVIQLAADDTMTDSMRHLFYVYHPDLESKELFGSNCTDSEKTIVLGCYVKQRGIYLYNVTDPRLNGVIQVTAAHESLHAAYDRLSSSERRRIDALTAQAYAGVTDSRIRGNIDAYRKKDASVVPNELHSILGTEVRNLPPELEAYYKRYFTNRTAIVSFSEQYEQEFTSRQQKVQTDDARLKTLKVQIDDLNGILQPQSKDLTASYDHLQSLKRSGQVEAYNAAVPGYNQLVAAYNANVRKVQDLITQYNQLVAERNALALEENELIQAIDSRPATIEAQ